MPLYLVILEFYCHGDLVNSLHIEVEAESAVQAIAKARQGVTADHGGYMTARAELRQFDEPAPVAQPTPRKGRRNQGDGEPA